MPRLLRSAGALLLALAAIVPVSGCVAYPAGYAYSEGEYYAPEAQVVVPAPVIIGGYGYGGGYRGGYGRGWGGGWGGGRGGGWGGSHGWRGR